MILVTWHHLFGVEAGHRPLRYLQSLGIGLPCGVICGLLAFAADFIKQLRIASLRRQGVFVRVLPDIATIVLATLGLGAVVAMGFGLLSWSDFVYGFGVFGPRR